MPWITSNPLSPQYLVPWTMPSCSTVTTAVMFRMA